MGISLEEYEKYEREDIQVDLKLASRIAGIFKRNWSVFLLDDLPQQPLVKTDNRTVENQTPSLHERTIEAIEDANYILEFSEGLSTYNGFRIPKYDNIKDLDAESLGILIRKISNVSINDQKKFRNSSDAFKHWRSFVESMGIFISQYPLNAEDKIRAFSLSDRDRAVIVLNTNDTTTGRIFSLFHELCHILRRSSGICDLHYSKSSDVEAFCNQFAATFLAPREFIVNHINSLGKNVILSDLESYAERLSGLLKVSRLVIYRRFASLGVISDRDYSRIHKEFLAEFITKHKKPTDELHSGGPNFYLIRKIRNGIAYSNTILNALSIGEINTFEASNALGVGVHNLNEYRVRTVQNEFE